MGIQDVEPGAAQVEDQGPGPDGKRYIKISVPHFNGDGNAMASYLRIGAVEPDVRPGVPNTMPGTLDNTGEDLASLVTGFADDLRVRTPADPGEITAAGLGAVTSDIGTATNLPPGEVLPPETTASISSTVAADQPSAATQNAYPGTVNNRLAESAVLHTKGGWRDHSDGNRVTTTRGDKVEVIQGNYKMVVLGRQPPFDATNAPNLGSAAGWDLSGGLVDDADLDKSTSTLHQAANAYSLEYTWEKNTDGVWGWTQTSTVGNPNTFQNPSQMGNGKQISYTWVDDIQTFIGGAPPGNRDYITPPPVPPLRQPEGNWRVARLYSRTFVNAVDSVTDVEQDITQSTFSLEGTMTTFNSASKMITTTTAGHFSVGTQLPTPDPGDTMSTFTASSGSMTNTTQTFDGGDMGNYSRSSGGMTNETHADATMFNHVTSGSLMTDLTEVPLHMTFEISATLLDVKPFAHIDVHNVHLDIHNTHMDLHLGPHATVDLFPAVVWHAAPATGAAPLWLWL